MNVHLIRVMTSMQRKNVTIVIVGSVLLFSSIGCRGTLPPDPPPEFQGQTVRVACPDELRDLVVAQSRVWEARQEARVLVSSYPAGAPPEGVVADALLFAPADLPRLVTAGRLQKIPEEMTRRGADFDWDRLLHHYSEQLVLWNRIPYAVPIVGEAAVCVYRSDLIDSPQWQKRFTAWMAKSHPGVERPLRAPASWEEFALLANFFRDEHPSGKPGPSLPPLSENADGVERLYMQVAAGYVRRAVRRDEQRGPDYLDDVFSFTFDQNSGTPRIASPGFVRALQTLIRLQPFRPPGASRQPVEAILEGQAVLGIVEVSAVAKLQASKLRDKIGVCAVPGSEMYFTAGGEERTLKQGVNRVPYLGGAGWLAGVVPSSAQAEAAMDLLAELAGPIRSSQIAQEPRWGGGPTRIDALIRDRWDSFDLDAPRTRLLRETLNRSLQSHGLENPATVMRLPDRLAFRDALVAGLRRSLLEKADASESLRGVSQKWKSIIEKRGAANHRRDNRLGLGLVGN